MKGLSMAELCYSERWVVTIQTVRPSKPKILAIWPLMELVDSALSSITLFPKADRHLSFLIIPELPSICHRCHVLRSFFLPGGQQSELRLCISNSLVLLTSQLLLLLSHFSLVRLCANPIDGCPPGFPVPGILQARILEWIAISFSSACKWKVKRATLEASKCVEDAPMDNTMVGRSQQLAFLEEKYLAKETSQQTIKNKIK